jgi:pantoate--beta-alanine ligase
VIGPPVLARSTAELAAARAGLTGRVAVVMTMGALHAGHVEHIRVARRLADAVVVTIFVNPLQFGPGEDFDRYPRTLDADLRVCAGEGARLVYAPAAEDMYPTPPTVRVAAGPLGARLEGASRPGHFDGVLTVVAKLLHRVRPALATFGEKDAQQLALVRRMVADLDLPVRVVPVATVREPDGLAVSSRNRHLGGADRAAAAALAAALRAGVAAADGGRREVLAAAHRVLAGAPRVELDYLALVAEDSWDEAVASGPARLLVAARLGPVRLIDNMALQLPEAAGRGSVGTASARTG